MARVAFLLAEGFEDDAFRVPYDRIRAAGHTITVVGLEKSRFVEGRDGREKVGVMATPRDVRPEDFDLLLLPGGRSPDPLCGDAPAVRFVRAFAGMDRPIAAACRGSGPLAAADLVAGRRVTSWPSVQADLVRAGGCWEDSPVVEDGNLLTARNPGDLPLFADRILRRLGSRVPTPA